MTIPCTTSPYHCREALRQIRAALAKNRKRRERRIQKFMQAVGWTPELVAELAAMDTQRTSEPKGSVAQR